jgi:hypothetical protein
MRAALSVALTLLPGVTVGQSEADKATGTLPRFEDFLVPTPLAPRKDNAVISRSDPGLPLGQEETAAQFRKRLVKEARKGPNFAGHYTVVIWSCGSPCSNLAIVDVHTGETHDLPFVGVIGWGNCEVGPTEGDLLSYRVDSSLLIVTGSLEIPDLKDHTLHEGQCRRFYYQWDGSRLSLLRSVVPRKAAASK